MFITAFVLTCLSLLSILLGSLLNEPKRDWVKICVYVNLLVLGQVILFVTLIENILLKVIK